MPHNVERLGFALASEDIDENPGRYCSIMIEARQATQFLAQCILSSALLF